MLIPVSFSVGTTEDFCSVVETAKAANGYTAKFFSLPTLMGVDFLASHPELEIVVVAGDEHTAVDNLIETVRFLIIRA